MSVSVARTHGEDVPLEDAILSALEQAGVDTVRKEPPLAEFIDVAALERLFDDDPETLRVQAYLWSHLVTITNDEVRVHESVDLVHSVG